MRASARCRSMLQPSDTASSVSAARGPLRDNRCRCAAEQRGSDRHADQDEKTKCHRSSFGVSDCRSTWPSSPIQRPAHGFFNQLQELVRTLPHDLYNPRATQVRSRRTLGGKRTKGTGEGGRGKEFTSPSRLFLLAPFPLASSPTRRRRPLCRATGSSSSRPHRSARRPRRAGFEHRPCVRRRR